MDLKMENEATVQQFVIIDNTDLSIQVLSQMINIHRTRKILLILLTVMFTFSLFYLIFVSFSCIIYTHSWLCQYFNHNYEFFWAFMSLIYDSLWLLAVYRYHSRGLLFFVWLSTIFLVIFGIVLIMGLITIFQTILHFHMIATSILITSISSILICIAASILQVIVVLFSYKLSKLISKVNNPTIC